MPESPHLDVPLPTFDPDQGEVVLSPEKAEPGYWVGCPGVRHDASSGQFLLTYRQRRPRGHGALERGWRCALAVSEDGRHFDDVWEVEKTQLDSPSMERFCVVGDRARGYRLYLSYVDPADNRWRIDAVDSASLDGFDLERRFPVLTAESTGTEGVKDPYVTHIDGTARLFASYARAGSFGAARAHATADIYNVGVTTCPTGLAVSVGGVGASPGGSSQGGAGDFSWQGPVLDVGTGWDRYQARLGSVVALRTGGYLGFYDGAASVAENYEERCGLAFSDDLVSWRRLTHDQPWALSNSGAGSTRYLDVIDLDGTWWIYFEITRPDGSHELRLSRTPGITGGSG